MSSRLVKSGLNDLETYYQDRPKRARQLREQGRKVVGYFCCFMPVEFLTALDLVPYRIHGNVHEPITMADSYLENIMCPFVRSCFDLALKGEYGFLDGLVVPHSCDTVERIYDIWREHREPKYHHFLNVPHMIGSSSFEFFRRELEVFAKSLEEFSGRQLTEDGLTQAIQLHNRNRNLLRELYQLRKQDPPLLSGTEMTKLLIVGMGMPVEEYSDLVLRVTDEVKTRSNRPAQSQARILVYGSEMDRIDLVQLVEQSGASVVMDDTCTGTRYFWEDVDASIAPWDALASRYLQGIHCPRTCRPKGKNRQEDLEGRFAHLKGFVREFNVDGVILYIMRFCDTHELDAPDVMDYLKGMGIPALYLEDDYTANATGQLKTRISAFLEMVG